MSCKRSRSRTMHLDHVFDARKNISNKKKITKNTVGLFQRYELHISQKRLLCQLD